MDIESAVLAALLEEVDVTPKPGLVDRRNCGAHRDMGYQTFVRSAHAVAPHLAAIARVSADSAALDPRDAFPALRARGLDAEREMFRTTAGVNTHKGAIFTLGLLCAACGRLHAHATALTAEAVCKTAAAFVPQISLELQAASTAGGRVYALTGVRGARGEAEDGFPSLLHIAWPRWKALRTAGVERNEAAVRVLLALMASVTDTNVLARRGIEAAEEVRRLAAETERHFSIEAVIALDDQLIERWASPGGCADLLAATFLLDRLCI